MTVFSELAKLINQPSVSATLDELLEGGHVKSRDEAVEVLTLWGVMCVNKERIENGLPPRMELAVRREVQTIIRMATLGDQVASLRKSVEDHTKFIKSISHR